jgi:hypothetical protein
MRVILNISRFIHRPDLPLPMGVLDNILKWHWLPVNQLAHSVPVTHIVCYRHKQHEAEQGRRPKIDMRYIALPVNQAYNYWSEHAFEVSDRQPEGKGALDISANDLVALFSLLETNTEYTRIAVYPNQNFIHCDYAFPERGRRYFDSSWNQITRAQIIESLKTRK